MTVFTRSVAFPFNTAPNSNSLSHHQIKQLVPILSYPSNETRCCIGVRVLNPILKVITAEGRNAALAQAPGGKAPSPSALSNICAHVQKGHPLYELKLCSRKTCPSPITTLG